MTEDLEFYTNTKIEKERFKNILASTFSGLILKPEDIYFVTAWFSDIDLLDNRSGDYSSLNWEWGRRHVTNIDLLTTAVHSGCKLYLCVKKDEKNETALNKINNLLGDHERFFLKQSKDLHVKGLVTESVNIDGSANHTFFGVNKNEESIKVTNNKKSISNARINFRNKYFNDIENKEILETNERVDKKKSKYDGFF